MVLIGLILVALVSLALGLILASAPWLIASLVASAISGVWLIVRRDDLAAAPAGGARSPRDEKGTPGRVVGGGAPSALREPDEPAAGTGNTGDAGEMDGEASLPVAQPGDVWVVDGQPDFHTGDCPRLSAAAEPIPFAQAVEDGFAPCAHCQPQRTQAPPGFPGAAPAEVWVVDGRPDYHLPGCAELGAEGEPVPLTQAVEDGFAPCGVCAPDRASEQVARSVPAGALDEVWVVDGRPDYHLAGCDELSDAAELIPYQQAVEDGFAPCAVCEPERVPAAVGEPAATEVAEEPDTVSEATPEPATAPALVLEPPAAVIDSVPPGEPEQPAEARVEPPADEPAADVWVVAGRQRYHAADCVIITGQEAVAIPREQAVGDGFKPCSLCEAPA